MDTRWLDGEELDAWTRFIAVVELLPGVLDTQLRRDSGLSHFEYLVLAMLSEADGRVLRMTALAARTNATLARLSHVVSRLEARGLVERVPCPQDGRATNAHLTDAGWDAVVAAAPGHVETVRTTVLDALTRAQVRQLGQAAAAILVRVDPDGRMTPPLARRAHDPSLAPEPGRAWHQPPAPTELSGAPSPSAGRSPRSTGPSGTGSSANNRLSSPSLGT